MTYLLLISSVPQEMTSNFYREDAKGLRWISSRGQKLSLGLKARLVLA